MDMNMDMDGSVKGETVKMIIMDAMSLYKLVLVSLFN